MYLSTSPLPPPFSSASQSIHKLHQVKLIFPKKIIVWDASFGTRCFSLIVPGGLFNFCRHGRLFFQPCLVVYFDGRSLLLKLPSNRVLWQFLDARAVCTIHIADVTACYTRQTRIVSYSPWFTVNDKIKNVLPLTRNEYFRNDIISININALTNCNTSN